MITKDEILEWLEEVKDPEIPVLSLVDLGVIKNIELDDHRTAIIITPTFVGCPALEIMKSEILEVLQRHNAPGPIVLVSFENRWSSDNISEKGRLALKKFGLAPPREAVFHDIDVLAYATCPNCGSENTELRNPFGSTLCRSIHFCHDCKEAFEQFKPL